LAERISEMEQDQKVENLVTWFFLFAGFMSILVWGAMTREFEERCENSCLPKGSITPIYNFEHACFCDEGHGKWRKEDVR